MSLDGTTDHTTADNDDTIWPKLQN